MIGCWGVELGVIVSVIRSGGHSYSVQGMCFDLGIWEPGGLTSSIMGASILAGCGTGLDVC